MSELIEEWRPILQQCDGNRPIWGVFQNCTNVRHADQRSMDRSGNRTVSKMKKINSEWVIEEKKNKLSKATVKIDFNLAPGLNSLGKGKIRILFFRIFLWDFHFYFWNLF